MQTSAEAAQALRRVLLLLILLVLVVLLLLLLLLLLVLLLVVVLLLVLLLVVLLLVLLVVLLPVLPVFVTTRRLLYSTRCWTRLGGTWDLRESGTALHLTRLTRMGRHPCSSQRRRATCRW